MRQLRVQQRIKRWEEVRWKGDGAAVVTIDLLRAQRAVTSGSRKRRFASAVTFHFAKRAAESTAVVAIVNALSVGFALSSQSIPAHGWAAHRAEVDVTR